MYYYVIPVVYEISSSSLIERLSFLIVYVACHNSSKHNLQGDICESRQNGIV